MVLSRRVSMTAAALSRIRNSVSAMRLDSAADAMFEDELELDRATLRLDGFEMYAFVASMTAGFSFSALDALSGVEHWPWPIALTFAISMIVSIFTGIYATLTFALCSLYAKTALAEGKDDRMVDFLRATAGHRARGFQYFLLSIFCFLVQCRQQTLHTHACLVAVRRAPHRCAWRALGS